MAKPMGRFTVPQGPRLNPRIFQSEAACTSFGTRRRLRSLLVMAILSPDLTEVEFTDRSKRIPNAALECHPVLTALAVRCESREAAYASDVACAAPGAVE